MEAFLQWFRSAWSSPSWPSVNRSAGEVPTPRGSYPEKAQQAQKVAAPAPAKECLYNRLGGEKPVKTVIGLFYMKAFTDDRIKHWFEGLNKEKMEMKMAGFLKYGFGAETTYKGRDLTTGHADLVARGLCDADYDVVGELFVASLREAGVPEDLVDEIVTILESCRDAVLGRTAAPAAK